MYTRHKGLTKPCWKLFYTSSPKLVSALLLWFDHSEWSERKPSELIIEPRVIFRCLFPPSFFSCRVVRKSCTLVEPNLHFCWDWESRVLDFIFRATLFNLLRNTYSLFGFISLFSLLFSFPLSLPPCFPSSFPFFLLFFPSCLSSFLHSSLPCLFSSFQTFFFPYILVTLNTRKYLGK